MTTLYLVRHGQTHWNVEGRYQGQVDTDLTDLGRAQASTTAEQMKDLGISAIYSSDLIRAYQTAEALAKVTGLPIHTDKRLREIHQGEWQGILYPEIQARWAEEMERWQNDPWASRPPGGEGVEQLQKRVYAALDDIIANHPRYCRIAIFSHKLPIALLKIRYQGFAPERLWFLLPKNAAWEKVEVEGANHHDQKESPSSIPIQEALHAL